MSRVLVAQSSGAVVYVFADDHCPPHVHARHRGEEWIARVEFSFAGDAVRLLSIEPLRHAPRRRVLNLLLEEIQDHLADCRRIWWATRETTCLENQWVKVTTSETVEFLGHRTKDSKRIVAARYAPDTHEVRLTLHDESTATLRLKP